MNQQNDVQLSIQTCNERSEKSLDLSHKKLKDIPLDALELRQLQCFSLGDNLIEEVPLKLCENLCQLTWLDLRRNQLTSLPSNISLLLSLKHLLLEGNHITKLPLELGLLSRLSGLNLKDNPLEFPPVNIIEQGTKCILEYLRTLHDNTNCSMEQRDIAGRQNTLGSNVHEQDLHMANQHYRIARYSTETKEIKHSLPRYNSGYMRKTPIEETYYQQVEDAERRKMNEKIEGIIQKGRNKVALDDWRREAAKLQRTKQRSKSATRHELNIPYDNDLYKPIAIQKDEKDSNDDLEERIKEHVRILKEWHSKDKKKFTVEEELEETKQNLQKAEQLQKLLEEKKALKLREEAFNANDYIPPLNR